jgi:hypothetical protein
MVEREMGRSHWKGPGEVGVWVQESELGSRFVQILHVNRFASFPHIFVGWLYSLAYWEETGTWVNYVALSKSVFLLSVYYHFSPFLLQIVLMSLFSVFVQPPPPTFPSPGTLSTFSVSQSLSNVDKGRKVSCLTGLWESLNG